MNLLDENIRHDQGQQLRNWRIPFGLLICDLARSGIQDAEIIPLLHRDKYPTVFTHDKHYFKRTLVHSAYCLVWLDLYDGDAALFVRRFLRHPEFNSHAKRMGKVVRLHPQRINFWQTGKGPLQTVNWPAIP